MSIMNEDKSIKYKNENGQLHREDGPALEWPDGTKEWWLNDVRHREDGPALVITRNGVVSNHWYFNGKRHREDGPASELGDGTKAWWLNGKELFGVEEWMEENDIDLSADEGRVAFKLRWG